MAYSTASRASPAQSSTLLLAAWLSPVAAHDANTVVFQLARVAVEGAASQLHHVWLCCCRTRPQRAAAAVVGSAAVNSSQRLSGCLCSVRSRCAAAPADDEALDASESLLDACKWHFAALNTTQKLHVRALLARAFARPTAAAVHTDCAAPPCIAAGNASGQQEQALSIIRPWDSLLCWPLVAMLHYILFTLWQGRPQADAAHTPGLLRISVHDSLANMPFMAPMGHR